MPSDVTVVIKVSPAAARDSSGPDSSTGFFVLLVIGKIFPAIAPNQHL